MDDERVDLTCVETHELDSFLDRGEVRDGVVVARLGHECVGAEFEQCIPDLGQVPASLGLVAPATSVADAVVRGSLTTKTALRSTM